MSKEERVWDGYADFRFGEHSREEYEEQVARDAELEFYREALRFRGFDEELPENIDAIQVLDDDVVYGDYLISVGMFYRVDDGDYSLPVSPQGMLDKGFTGWRPTPGDLMELWNKIAKDKSKLG